MYKIKLLKFFTSSEFRNGKCFLLLKFPDSGIEYPFGQWSVVIEKNHDELTLTPMSTYFPHDKMTQGVEFELFRAPEKLLLAKLIKDEKHDEKQHTSNSQKFSKISE